MIVIADPDRSFRARVAEQLSRRAVLREMSRLQDIEAMLADPPPDLAVILFGPGLAPAGVLAVASRFQIAAPEVSCVLVADAMSSDLLQDALHAGVRDVLPLSFTPAQLTKAVTHAEEISHQMRERDGTTPAAERSGDHRMITVLSCKGGVGKSFVASNLAVLLARRGFEVALVDLDLQFGDLAIMLQVFPQRTICDVARDLDRLDDDAVRRYLTPHRSHVALMAAPTEPGLSETVSADAAVAILRMLKNTFSYVVVDTPPSFTDHVLYAIDESEMLVSVTTMDIPSIKNTKIMLQTLDLLGVDREGMRLVLNRADSKVGLSIHEVEKTLGRSVHVAIPSSRDVPLSVNRGVPIVIEDPRSQIATALSRLADSVDGAVPPKRESPRHDAPGRFHVGRKR